MKTFSEDIQDKAAHERRRLYSLFQRAVKNGSFPALKLLTRFEITGSKGQARQVHDYAYTEATALQVADWMLRQEQERPTNGFSREDLQGISDEDLTALIQKQTRVVKASKPRRKRKAKTTANSPVQATEATE